MSISQDELFYRGHNPSSWYSGYNESWIMKAIAAASAEKESEKKMQEETKKMEGEKKKQDDVKKVENNGVIELRMPLCCEGCIEKVQKKLKAMDGVASVLCDQEQQKVIVKGDAKPEAVLKKAKKILKRSEFWVTKEKK